MADSNITKRALATSLKELMLEQPFDKINVAQICARCNMNRKSFYYHFKDKSLFYVRQHLKGYHNNTYGYKSSCCGNGIGIVVEHLKELEHIDICPINPE